MDQILEFIVPAIVLIAWAINSVVQSKQNKGEEEDVPEYTPLEHEANQRDEDDRTRRIQDEIRRMISERRGDTPQEEPQTAPSTLGPITLGEEHARTSTLTEASQPRSFPRPDTSSTEPSYVELPQPQRNYEAEMLEQRRRIEETHRRAEEARKQTLARLENERKTAYDTVQRERKKMTRTYTGSLSSQVQQTLKDPFAARKAVLYYEILGTPVGMREKGQLRPHWEM
ncbi:MAG: hypothetical protein AAGF10_03820 [Verrucomicrobiota bacterium]